MDPVTRVIVNELGNTVLFSVEQNQHGVHVSATGPHSWTEHTWTPMEAATLQEMFQILPIDETAEYTGPE